MNTKKLLEKHFTCVELLEAVISYEDRISELKHSIEFAYVCQEFPNIKAKRIHEVEICTMCIARLMNRYNKLKQ